MNANCLTDEQLHEVASSLESAAADASIILHLDHCELCQQRLESIASTSIDGDLPWVGLRTPPQSSANLIATIDQLSNRSAAAGRKGSTRYDDLEPWLEPSSDNGATTLDSYELLECVGRGGMGIVFRALDPTTNRVVALKAMAPDLARDGKARARFLREAKAIASVRHPNVVTLYSVNEVSDLPYLAMEFIEGESLDAKIGSGESIEPAEIARIGAAIASGLAACHEQGVIHRDIKPSNVLLSQPDSTVKITDFGLAAVASTPTLTQNGYLSGTPDYVAPERLTIGSEADERSDLFSLGCLLYAMSTGEEPFGGDTPLITLHRIATERPVPVRVKNPAIPAPLERTIVALMAKKPKDRPVSAQEAQRMLLGNRPLSQSRATATRRWTMVAILMMIGVLSAAVLTPSSNPVSERVIVSTSRELESALTTIADGGEIQIDADGTLAIRPMEVVGKSLTIKATDGRAPQITLMLEEDDSPPDFLLRVSRGGLHLVGLSLSDDFQLRMHPERDENIEDIIDAESYSLVSIENSAFSAKQCRFETQSLGCCVELVSSENAHVSESQLFASSGSAINWSAESGDRLVLDDCVAACVSAIVATLKGRAELEWTESTTLTDIAAIELTHAAGSLVAEVSDCVFQSQEALVMTSLKSQSVSQFKQLLTWRGVSNRILGQELHIADVERPQPWTRHVAQWALTDNNSTYLDKLFKLPHEEVCSQLREGKTAESLLLGKAPR
ncbi:MAG: serine/threonine-protein kinase [Planctomycetota bacterium]